MNTIKTNEVNDDKIIEYERSLEYWAEIPPTVDGVLGGFGFISDLDIKGSQLFLNSLLSSRRIKTDSALDCGAGIGRVSKHLLTPHFDVVDIVESDKKFINTILSFVGDNSYKIGKKYNVRLQEFIPERQYDVIWIQWVLGYLTDEHLLTCLVRCSQALTENGVIVVKENVTSSGDVERDEIDSSVTRPLKSFLTIFKSAGLKKIKQCKQTDFPNGVYPVYMIALVPANIKNIIKYLLQSIILSSPIKFHVGAYDHFIYFFTSSK